jgi:hypothetical protein
MAFNNDAGHNGSVAQMPYSGGQGGAPVGWKELAMQRPPRRSARGRILALVSIVLLLLVIFAALRLSAVASSTNDQLVIHVGDQQAATVDLRQSIPISPYLLGTNVFPKAGTISVGQHFSGFMNYTPVMQSGLRNMNVKLLRYPGGNWGETNILSYDQLRDFSQMMIDTNSDGMIQAHLSGPVVDNIGVLEPKDVTADVNSRANLAGSWVSYMNNPKSYLRTGAHKNDPYHPVKFWTVGNEPDQQIDPVTGKKYTVADYVNAFIQFSKTMHANDPTIKVFGPELSDFVGVGACPCDATGVPWMDGFLKGIAAYERQHYGKDLHFHLLDGVSFHFYQFNDAQQDPSLLLSSSDEWNYLLGPLRNLIQSDFGRNIPIAVTEINTNPTTRVPSPGLASLWWADTLGELMNQQVAYVAFFSASGVALPYPLFTQNGLQETAMGRVMELFAHLQHNLVPLSIQHDPISVYATQDNTHQMVSLLFINKSAATQAAQIDPANQVAGVSPWPSQSVTLAPYSIVVVTLHRNGGAEAYNFVEPTTNTATIDLVNHTICGNNTDPLASSIPC